jgi:hypothetical protein
VEPRGFLSSAPCRTARLQNRTRGHGARPPPAATRPPEPATTSMRLVVLVITPCVINEVGHRARQGSAKCSTATSTKSIGAAVNRQFYTDARTPAGPVVPLFFGSKADILGQFSTLTPASTGGLTLVAETMRYEPVPCYLLLHGTRRDARARTAPQ